MHTPIPTFPLPTSSPTLLPLLPAYLNQIRITLLFYLLRRQPQRNPSRLLLDFLHPPNLLLPLLHRRHLIILIALGVPREILAFLPPADGRHDRVAKVVFPVLGCGYIGPFEVCAAAAVRAISTVFARA
jgi:hypothetical protein